MSVETIILLVVIGPLALLGLMVSFIATLVIGRSIWRSRR